MYDTHVTVVGNVLREPEWRRTANTGALVTTFKIASTARRLNRETGQWVDGNTLRVRVTCWRGLASNVKHSVTLGDPVIVTGRLFTRDWRDSEGVLRTQYELEATAVGHDLSRGRAVFERVRPHTSTSAVEDAQTQERVGGEPTEPVPDEEAPSRFNDLPYEIAARAVEAGSDGPVTGGVGTGPAGAGPAEVRTRGADHPLDPADAGPAQVGTREVSTGEAGPGESNPEKIGPGEGGRRAGPVALSPVAGSGPESPEDPDPAQPDPLDPDPADHDLLDPAAVEASSDGRGRRRPRRAKVPA